MSSPNPSHITYSSEKVIWNIVAKNNGSVPYNNDVKVALSWNHPVNYLRVSSDTDGMQGVQFGDGSAVGTVFNRTTSVWNVGPLSVGQEKRLYVETSFDALQNLDNLLPLILTKTLTLDSGNIPNNVHVVSSDVLMKGVIPFPSEVDCSKVRYGPAGPPGPVGLTGPKGDQGDPGLGLNFVLETIDPFDSLNPLDGWVQPPLVDGSSAVVKFANGVIVFYICDGTSWDVGFDVNRTNYTNPDGTQWTWTTPDLDLMKVGTNINGAVELELGDTNRGGVLTINGGSLGKKWSVLAGSTANPTTGIDESLQIGINLLGTPGYNAALNSLKLEFETNYKDVGYSYDEFYLQWYQSSSGKTYRNFMTGFNETTNDGVTPWMETSIVGRFDVRPTADLSVYSNTPITFQVKENGQVGVSPLPVQLSVFDVSSENATYPAISVRSASQQPAIGFSNYSSGTGLSPMYAEVSMQNISATANTETGRLLFKLRKNGTKNTKFTMHEDGLFGINKTPTKALHILDANFVAGQISTSILLEGTGIGGANGDGLGIGFRPEGGTSDVLRLGMDVNSGYNFFVDFVGTKKFQVKLSTGEVQIGSSISFMNTNAIDGSGVSNGNIFKGVDGALYYKGGSGTVTLLGPEVYSLGTDISQPFTNWTYTKTFVNGNETNITRWDVTSNTAKHKDARRIAGYYDRLALPISLDKDKLYRVDFEVTNYVGGSIAVNIGESFTFNASANGSYTDYVKTSNGDFIAIQSFGADLTITNIVVREVITQTQNFFGKIYSRDGIKTDGYIETGVNKRILIGSWDNGTNFQDDQWQVFENNQPSISIGYNSMSRGTGVAVGPNAGKENTNLGYITAFGINALRRNTTGHASAFGTGALQNNTTSESHAFGDECLSSSVTGINNGFGYYCLNLNTGFSNSGFGHEAGRFINGNENTFMGYRSGTGVLTAVGDQNSAFGNLTLASIVNSGGNVAVGSYALNGLQQDGHNIAIGMNAMLSRTTGWENVAIGTNAGRNSTGSGCVFIGNRAGYNTVGSNILEISNVITVTPLIGGNFSTQELKIGGVQQFSITYPTSGVGVANGSIFYATTGGLYFKGGSGTVTLIGPA